METQFVKVIGEYKLNMNKHYKKTKFKAILIDVTILSYSALGSLYQVLCPALIPHFKNNSEK